MPLPFLIERPDEVSANWRIGTPTTCANGCDAIIAEIAARLWPLYLHDPTAVAVKNGNGSRAKAQRLTEPGKSN